MSRSSSAIKSEIDTDLPPRMSWNSLLCATRMYPKQREYSQDRTAFEIDYDRLIFSKPFRRLARKTQVHPLAVNDHTHNRLTHSLEVASVGRSLGKCAYRIVQRYEPETIPATGLDFAELVQAACLAHDVGNTPFGHAGERAIRQWMTQHGDLHSTFTPAQRSDLTLYEGNAQAFRIATHSISEFEAGHDNRQGGIGLTAATLATMMKYPWHSDNPYAQAAGKYSIFQTDLSAFDWVVNAVGLIKKDNTYCRHPLTFLVEAADDICNAVIDIEDALDLHILNRADVESDLMQLSGLTQSSTIAQMRATSVGRLIDQCLTVFSDNYESIMTGLYPTPLIYGIDEPLLRAFNALNQTAKENVYPFQQDETMEQDCFTIFDRILTLSMYKPIEVKQLASDPIARPYALAMDKISQDASSDYERLIMIMDFVAGMTDNYAVNLAGRLHATNNNS